MRLTFNVWQSGRDIKKASRMAMSECRMKKILAAMILIMSCLVGSASAGVARTVKFGDVAQIHFLCRLRNGEVVAATDRLAGKLASLPKSAVFLERKSEGPLSVEAVRNLPKSPLRREPTFEEEIIDRLAVHIAGMREGEHRRVSLTADDLQERDWNDYVLRIARTRVRPVEMRMTRDDYQARTGKSPAVGQSFVADTTFPAGRVEAITDRDVIVRFSANTGDVVQTPFGKGRITREGKNFKVNIDARKGSIVRTGPYVGCITEADKKFITIDYRNPFGGETLICDVTVGKVTGEKTARKEAEE